MCYNCEVVEDDLELCEDKDDVKEIARRNDLELVGLSSGKIRVYLFCKSRYIDIQITKEQQVGGIG